MVAQQQGPSLEMVRLRQTQRKGENFLPQEITIKVTATQGDLYMADYNAVSGGSTALFGNSRKSPKQSAILAALRDKPEITLAEAVQLIGGNLYCNAEKHVGVTLSNMVKRGMLKRVKRGVFCLPNDQAQPPRTERVKQPEP